MGSHLFLRVMSYCSSSASERRKTIPAELSTQDQSTHLLLAAILHQVAVKQQRSSLAWTCKGSGVSQLPSCPDGFNWLCRQEAARGLFSCWQVYARFRTGPGILLVSERQTLRGTPSSFIQQGLQRFLEAQEIRRMTDSAGEGASIAFRLKLTEPFPIELPHV